MENIIIILGPKTEETRKSIELHYSNSLSVEASFTSLTEFHSEYYGKVMKVDRIVILESAFSQDMYGELTLLREVLDTFYASVREVLILTSTSKDVIEVATMMKQSIKNSQDIVKIYDNESYNPRMIIEYCLGHISRRHYTKTTTEFEDVVRYRKGKEDSFEVMQEPDEIEDTSVVVLGDNRTTLQSLEEKRKNLLSLAQSSKSITWEASPIIKDILRINDLTNMAQELERYDIDYSMFYLKNYVKKEVTNLFVVTGEKRSGKSTAALSIAKSASEAGLKVLIIDTDVVSLGLSDLIERSGINLTAMLLQDFLTFGDSIKTLVKNHKRLHSVVLNSDTKKELKGIKHTSLINVLATAATKYYDLVILDISLADISDLKPVLKSSNKTIITVPYSVASVLSSYKAIINEPSFKLVDDKMLFMPTSLFNTLDGVLEDRISDIRGSIKYLLGNDKSCTPPIKLEGFDLDETLYKVISAK